MIKDILVFFELKGLQVNKGGFLVNFRVNLLTCLCRQAGLSTF